MSQAILPDDVVDGYLSGLLGTSDPGDTMHHLLVSSGGTAAMNAFGQPIPGKLEVTIYAMAPDDSVDADGFVAKTIMAAVVDARQKNRTIYFAALAREVHVVIADGTELTENLARRLGADKKLHEHPSAVEVTQLYAVCRDGRRWAGEHYLTGPKAGTVDGPTLLQGSLRYDEHDVHRRLLRIAVGIESPGQRMPPGFSPN